MLLPTLALNVSTFLAHRLVPLQETGVVVEPTLTISLSRSGPFVHSVFLEDCLCATQIFVELNGCLSCVALQNTTEYSELTRQAGGTSLLTFPSSVFSTHYLTFFSFSFFFLFSARRDLSVSRPHQRPAHPRPVVQVARVLRPSIVLLLPKDGRLLVPTRRDCHYL